MNFQVRTEDISHDFVVILNPVEGQPVHAQILRQEGVAMLLDHIRMVVLEERVHLLDLLARQWLDDEHSVVAHVELRARFASGVGHDWLRAGERLTVLDVIDAEALAKIFEHKWTVFLKFEVRWHVFPKNW